MGTPKKGDKGKDSQHQSQNKEKEKEKTEAEIKKEKREQNAILRAQRAKAAEDEKKSLFGNWTGKTPGSSFLSFFLFLLSFPSFFSFFIFPLQN
jgi:hypothetical protein